MKRVLGTSEQGEKLLIKNAKKALAYDTLYSKTQLYKLLHHLSTKNKNPVRDIVNLLIRQNFIKKSTYGNEIRYSLILEVKMTESRELELRRLEKYKETSWLTNLNGDFKRKIN
ncbi:hypothetical protein [Maribacter sp. Asnod2-G09]|uniref:hypothetical protein n=1 Tax=Maribacter sp. Asnod2-G09 TaxID=3160577 RepID=UPI0038680B6A